MALTRQPSRNVLVLQNSGAEVSTAQNISPFYQWVVNGELTFPQVESQDALHQIDASFLIHQVRVSAKEAGTSTYNIRILSHDVNGGSEVVLVDEAIVFSVDKGIHLLPILTAQIPENSTLEMTIFEQTVGVPAKDVTVSLIGQPFTEIHPIQNGHKVQDSLDATYVQRDNLKFDTHFNVVDDLGNDRTEVGFIDSSLDSYLDPFIDGRLSKVAIIRETTPSGTSGGTFNQNIWITRQLNILEGDTSFITLISNQITLQPGKYSIEASAIGWAVLTHQAKIYNVSDLVNVAVGTSEYSGNTTVSASSSSKIIGIIDIPTTKIFELQHKCSASKNTNGFGIDAGLGIDNVFAQIKIIKLV